MHRHGLSGLVCLSLFLVCGLMLIGFVPVSEAQTGLQQEVRTGDQLVPDLHRARAQMIDFSAAMEDGLQQYLELNRPNVSDDPYYHLHLDMMRKARNAFVQARHLLPAASDEDIEKLRVSFAQMPQLLPATTTQAIRIRPVRRRSAVWMRLETGSVCNGDQYSETSSGAEAIIGLDFGWVSGMVSGFLELFTVEHNTVDPYPGTIPTPDFTAYDAGLTGAAQCTEAQALLDLIYDLIPDTIGDVSVGVSVGLEISVGKDIPNPLKTGFAILSSVNKLICVRMDLANALGDDCNLNASFDIIGTKLEMIASDIAIHDARLVAHDNAMMVQHTEIIDLINSRADAIDAALLRQLEFLELFRGLTVQMAIEKNMLDDGNDVISLFELPAGVSDPGGIDGTGIELVREIVREAIENSRAAGLPVFQADSQFERGDADLADGDYRNAFDNYRQAYISAVK